VVLAKLALGQRTNKKGLPYWAALLHIEIR